MQTISYNRGLTLASYPEPIRTEIIRITRTSWYYRDSYAPVDNSSHASVHTWTSESNSQFSIVSRPDAPASLDAPIAEKLPAETVLTVCEKGVARGYLFISVNTTVPIDVLECKLSFNGAYIRRVYVDQAHRNRGVATALITAANRYASARDATQAVALVAIDNRPSQALFETCGFTVRSTRVYARIGPLSIRHQLPNTQ
jgi:ribosomal protein S18 acetylase RimI-like enzyme